MADLSQTLVKIARERRNDPLAPVTVIVPSHVAGIQLRRRLGAQGPFAAVRFETLPRLAEIIAAGELAAKGRAPLARPIGDYLAAQVALESRKELSGVRELPGFGRILRQLFRRLRRAGIASPEGIRLELSNGYMGELLRLYGEFRSRSARFYDEEDLMDAAADLVRRGTSAVAPELGAVYVVPPGALSFAADGLLKALRRAAPTFANVAETSGRPQESFVLAPDPASEAREVVREVLKHLEDGAALHEVGVFHGADPLYQSLLRDAFLTASVPAGLMPGLPLSETVAGRAVLALASLPAEDYSRTAVMDFFALAPLRARIPGLAGTLTPRPATWDRLSRAAGVTRSAGRWQAGLDAMTEDLEADLQGLDSEDWRRAAIERDLGLTGELRGAIEALMQRLEPLRPALPAATFVERFKAVVSDYLTPGAQALENVIAEIDQLGTVGAVGGSFALASFVQALRANLEIAALRERGLGEGILVADYRIAAGLRFRHAVLCGAFEGSFPARPGGDTLVDDADWASLRQRYPFIEDAALRIERAREAAGRAIASAVGGSLVWTAPLYEPGGAREYYPSHSMVATALLKDPSIDSASKLRGAPPAAWLRRSPSPLAAELSGPAVSKAEHALRRAVSERLAGVTPGPGHPLQFPLLMLRSRRGLAFGEYEGNVAALSGGGRLWTARSASPTSLETYAACGFKYLCGYVLRLSVAEEPEERELMDPAERGTLMHQVLDAFFKEKVAEGRPGPGESWGPADVRRVLQIAEQHLVRAHERGKSGLDIFADHDARAILADLAAFLEEDSRFREETGAVPSAFEVPLPHGEVAGITMRGFVDRIDRSEDGRRAWVIDYKTGSSFTFDDLDPLASGTKLQLPAYVAAAADADQVEALYWFISRKGEYRRVGYDPSPQNQDRYQATVTTILDGIRAGAFPAVPGDEDEFYGTWSNCRYCDFSRMCSRRRDQDFARIAGLDAVAPWRSVGEIARELRP